MLFPCSHNEVVYEERKYYPGEPVSFLEGRIVFILADLCVVNLGRPHRSDQEKYSRVRNAHACTIAQSDSVQR